MKPSSPPANAPRRGNRFSRALGRLGLRLLRWRFVGEFPDRSRLVIVVAPHTSNWDFVTGIAVVFATGLNAHWLVKDNWFRWPLGYLAHWLGGIPVDRSRSNALVEQTSRAFADHERLWLAVTPEGTRKKVARWKSGFWHIARDAGVPIALCYFDYRKRETGFGALLEPGDDYAADLERILAFYQGVTPCHPENF